MFKFILIYVISLKQLKNVNITTIRDKRIKVIFK